MSLLIEAIGNNRFEEAIFLINENCGGNINARAGYEIETDGWAEGTSVLHVAVFRQSFFVVEALLKKPTINVNVVHTHGISPLVRACIEKYDDIAKLIVEKKGGINFAGDNSEYTPLTASMAAGNYRMVEYFLQQDGIDVNKGGTKGSPLRFAIDGQIGTKLLKLLLKYHNNKLKIDLIQEEFNRLSSLKKDLLKDFIADEIKFQWKLSELNINSYSEKMVDSIKESMKDQYKNQLIFHLKKTGLIYKNYVRKTFGINHSLKEKDIKSVILFKRSASDEIFNTDLVDKLICSDQDKLQKYNDYIIDFLVSMMREDKTRKCRFCMKNDIDIQYNGCNHCISCKKCYQKKNPTKCRSCDHVINGYEYVVI